MISDAMILKWHHCNDFASYYIADETSMENHDAVKVVGTWKWCIHVHFEEQAKKLYPGSALITCQILSLLWDILNNTAWTVKTYLKKHKTCLIL